MIRSLLYQFDQRGADTGRVNTRQHLTRSGARRGNLADLKMLEPGPIENQGTHLVRDNKLFIRFCHTVSLNELEITSTSM